MVEDVFENPFGPYMNKHSGQSAVFFGSGPSILQFDFATIPDEFLRFGTNDQIFLEGIDLDYWFMGDAMPQVPSKFYDRFQEYDDYSPKKQKFVRYCNWKDDRKISVPNWGEVPRNGQLPLNLKNSKYYICDSGGNPSSCLFRKDISLENLVAVASISFEVLQFILFCGVKNIFLVGHDCDYSNGTFAKIMIGKQQQADYYILRYWKIVKDWISKNYPDVKLFSINPVALDIFPEIVKFK
tara:strand:+ start:510 stop:1229 length:720 start_codon:yes stop_codon:yes gene_type:complete